MDIHDIAQNALAVEIKWLHANIKKYDGYMVPFIQNMYARLKQKGLLAAYSHNEKNFIMTAYYEHKR